MLEIFFKIIKQILIDIFDKFNNLKKNSLNLLKKIKEYNYKFKFVNFYNTYLTIFFFELIKIFNIKEIKKEFSFFIIRGPSLEIYTIQKVSLISISLRITGFFLIFSSLLLYSIFDIFFFEMLISDIFDNFIKNIRNFQTIFYSNIIELSIFIEKNTITEETLTNFKLEMINNDLIIKVINNEKYSYLKQWIASSLYFFENVILGETSFKIFNDYYYSKDKILFLTNNKDILNNSFKEGYLLNSSYEKHPFLHQIYVFDILDIFNKKSLDIFDKKNLNETYDIMKICYNSENFIKNYPINLLNDLFLNLIVSIILLFIFSHAIIASFKNKKENSEQNILNFYNSNNNQFIQNIYTYVKPHNFIKIIILDFIKKYIIISKSLLNYLYEIFNFGKFFNFDFMDPIRKNWINIKWNLVKTQIVWFQIINNSKEGRNVNNTIIEERLTNFEERYLSHLSITLRYMSSRFIGYYIILTFPKIILKFGFLIFNFYALMIPEINNIFISIHLNNNIINEILNEINLISNKFIKEIETTPRATYISKIDHIISTTKNGKTFEDASIHNLNSFFYNRQYILRNNPKEVFQNTFFREDYQYFQRRPKYFLQPEMLSFSETATAQGFFDSSVKNLFRIKNKELPIEIKQASNFRRNLLYKITRQELGFRVSMLKLLNKEFSEIESILKNYYNNNNEISEEIDNMEIIETFLRKEALIDILSKLENMRNFNVFVHPIYKEHLNFIGYKSKTIVTDGGMDNPHSYNFLFHKGWVKIYDITSNKYKYKYYTSKFLFNSCMTQQRFLDPKISRFYIRENGIHVGT